jgi:hypothetical protein
MKRAFVCGSAIAAALMMAAALGAASASATVLCKENKSPCGTSAFGAGTELKAQLGTFTLLFENMGTGQWLNECSQSTLNGKISNAGGVSTPVAVPLSSATASSCLHPVEVLKPGSMEIRYLEGVGFAEVIFSQLEWKEGTCTYSTGTKYSAIGHLYNTESAGYGRLPVEIRAQGSGFLCPTGAKWITEYRVPVPNPFYVKPS